MDDSKLWPEFKIALGRREGIYSVQLYICSNQYIKILTVCVCE